MIEGYKTVSEVALEWGLKPRTIQIMCAEDKVKGAVKFGRSWAIPTEAKRPVDGREASGLYKGWRKKIQENK